VLPSDVVQDNNYIHTDNNYTGEEKTKVANSLVAEDLEDYYTSEEVDTIIE
jgi:hypothetical protein